LLGYGQHKSPVKTDAVVKELEDEPYHYHSGKKVRNISNGLNNFLIPAHRKGIQEQSKNNGNGEVNQKTVKGKG
jgi:hypothetical protein